MTTPRTTAATVGDLITILAAFDPATPLMLNSHDGPDYGSLEIGRGLSTYPHENATLEITNPE